MASTRVTMDSITLALSMREAGLTVAIIAQEIKLPVGTTKSLLARFGAIKGRSRAAVVEGVRKKLVENTTLQTVIESQIAASITNDLAMARQIQDECSSLFEQLANDKRTPLASKARTLSSIASAAQLAQSIVFRSLAIEDVRKEITQAELPTLTIEGYTSKEIEEIKSRVSMTDVELAALDGGAINDYDVISER